jgi:DNA helicase II / ATP-dependent DNA helicase PcrA
MRLPPDLTALTPAQRAAVIHPARPVLLACGPGSGRTRILTHRIHWLIHQGLRPSEILALTFSRADATELISRVQQALGREARHIWAGTLHGFGAWLLRREASAVARTPAFTILDRADTRRLVEQLCRDLALPGDPGSLAEALERTKRGVAHAGCAPAVCQLLPAYRARCREANALDFTDLLAEPVALLTFGSTTTRPSTAGGAPMWAGSTPLSTSIEVRAFAPSGRTSGRRQRSWRQPRA